MISERPARASRAENVPNRILIDDDVLGAELYGLAEDLRGKSYQPDLHYWSYSGTEPPPEVQVLLRERGSRKISSKRTSKVATRLVLAAAAI